MTAAITGNARLCEYCSEPLVRRHRENSKQWRGRRFCSRACFARGFAAQSESTDVSAIFASYVVDPKSGCWVWQGYMDRNGYGRCYDPSRPRGRRTEWAHRAFYRRHKGPIPARYEVDHECQNTACVNPDHLDAVTKAEHVRRTWARIGIDDKHRLAAEMRSLRLTYGEIAEALAYSDKGSAYGAVRSAISKGLVDASSVPEPVRLTDAERDDIRDLHAIGIPQPELAAWYGVDAGHISRICNRRDARSRAAVEDVAA